MTNWHADRMRELPWWHRLRVRWYVLLLTVEEAWWWYLAWLGDDAPYWRAVDVPGEPPGMELRTPRLGLAVDPESCDSDTHVNVAGTYYPREEVRRWRTATGC